jgi:hypothetical protein
LKRLILTFDDVDSPSLTLSRIVLFVLFFGFTSFAAAAQSPNPRHPRTVVDYYMLLPDKYFEAEREQRVHWMLDPKRGAIVDIANGYLFAPGDGAQTDIYTCVFKRSNGTHYDTGAVETRWTRVPDASGFRNLIY